MTRAVTWLTAVLLVCLAASPALAQVQTPTPTQTLRNPLDLQRLETPIKAPMTLTPMVTVTEEFNDNIFLDNRNREWDLITGITPGITFGIERETYRLTAGYDFTAELFARNPSLDHAFDRQNFVLDGMYRVNPQLTLTLTEGFTFDTATNIVSPQGVSTGRGRSFSNTVSPGVTWQLSPLWAVRGLGSYTVQRFERSGLFDSNEYHAEADVDHRITRRLTGTVGYQFGYFDIQDQPKTTTHTPRIGGTFALTPTISLSASGGPSFEVREHASTRITPAVTASYQQRFEWGSAGLSYDRSVGTAGGFGGTTDNQSFGATVQVTTLMKGLTVALSPRYTTEKSSSRIDIKSFTLPLQASYRITAWMSAVAAYQFFRQRSDSTQVDRNGVPFANDVDQDRVFVGLTFGYPIKFD